MELDRWLIDIEGHTTRRLHMNWLPHRKLQMYNYFSVGVDAQIALDFHKARDSPFYLFSNRILNKVRIIVLVTDDYYYRFLSYVRIFQYFQMNSI